MLLCAGLLLLPTACASPSSNTYSVADVGRTIETAPGTVVSSRVVQIKGEPSGYGSLAGAAGGATVAGATIGSGSGSTIAAILGGIIGLGAGYLAEERLRDDEGIEYVLQMEDGRLVTLVQNREDEEEPLPDGTPVLVQRGGVYSRVIARPEMGGSPTAPGGGGGGWVDPDARGGGTPPAAPYQQQYQQQQQSGAVTAVSQA
jgi:outer membrane lipoprotein SlyB